MRYNAKKMLRGSRFKDFSKTLSADELEKTIKNMDRLIEENVEYTDKQNYAHLSNLFSSLALVWTFIDEGKSKEESQRIVFDAMYRYLEPKIPTMEWIAKHKWFVPLLKWMMPKKFKRTCGHGWKITYPKAPKNEFSMITHLCIYADIFRKYGMPEMTKGFCKVDNLMYGSLPKTRFSYSERIGEGGKVCDYVFKRIED